MWRIYHLKQTVNRLDVGELFIVVVLLVFSIFFLKYVSREEGL